MKVDTTEGIKPESLMSGHMQHPSQLYYSAKPTPDI